ncbi:DUF378 domain-containing protein [Candidatus Gracilibacteria bacterium]|nr:DUF378 domain-containing protein [Candidatus Gracilibacteria bacterium]
MIHAHTGKSCAVHSVSYVLVLIGALNWGLVALGYWMNMNLNLVNLLLGGFPQVENIVYLLVGLSALAMVTKGSCGYCK